MYIIEMVNVCISFWNGPTRVKKKQVHQALGKQGESMDSAHQVVDYLHAHIDDNQNPPLRAPPSTFKFK